MAECRGPSWHRLRGWVWDRPTPLPLTDHERRILALLATGMTAKEICRELTLAKRTLDNHLYRIGAKTGKCGRVALAVWWVTEGATGASAPKAVGTG